MGTRLSRLSEAVLTCNHDLCFMQKLENITIFRPKIGIFTAVKYWSIFHRLVFVMLICLSELLYTNDCKVETTKRSEYYGCPHVCNTVRV